MPFRVLRRRGFRFANLAQGEPSTGPFWPANALVWLAEFSGMRSPRPLAETLKELCEGDAEGTRKPTDGGDADVPLATLYTAHVVSVQFCAGS